MVESILVHLQKYEINKNCHSNVTYAPKGSGLAKDTFEVSYLLQKRYVQDTKTHRNEVRSQCQGQSDPQ